MLFDSVYNEVRNHPDVTSDIIRRMKNGEYDELIREHSIYATSDEIAQCIVEENW